jgi:Tol biopolymer transport system component
LALPSGTRLGVYEVTAQIGAGGMGEVYRATDSNLKRSVAIKVLPASVAGDADRLTRFQREAEVLAGLNHPNIGAIYGLEKTPDFTALVMELVEGDDLSQRIARGAIPLDEALPVAKQIAEALEAAHAQGIVHRDLKPANIKVRSDGTVKVLDFGLAKAVDGGGQTGGNLSQSPTITSPAISAMGVILGTVAYMSPEQARGRPVDKRTDMWAFGAVLYEMLTGCSAFSGATVSDTIAAVLDREPDWSRLPAAIPPSLQRLLRRLLKKDLRQRLADIRDAQIEIEEAGTEAEAATRSMPTPAARRTRIALLATAALLIGALVVLTVPFLRDTPVSPRAITRFNVRLPSGIGLLRGGDLAISPDGQTLVFVGEAAGKAQLYARSFDEAEPRPLTGTDAAAAPFFSPDGRWVAFFDRSENALKKIPLRGGPVQVLCRGCTSRPIGGYWGRDDQIVFSAWPNIGLWRVPANGGTPEAVLKPTDQTWFMWPSPVADRAVLFTTWRDGQAGIDAVVHETGERRRVIASGSHPRYVSGEHLLLYASEGRLMAASFDAERLTTRGNAVAVVDGMTNEVLAASFDVSLTGTLAYVSGPVVEQVVWKDRHGDTAPLTTKGRLYDGPMISPDGARLAVTIEDGFTRNLWVGRVGQEPLTRLTFGNDDTFSLWTSDSRRIVFTSGKGGRYNLFLAGADGRGQVERLTDTPNAQRPTSVSPSGDLVLFNQNAPSTGLDVWQLRLSQPHEVRPYIQTRFDELEGAFSPDGRWIVYVSNETGRYEVYVQAYPGPGDKQRISIDGGFAPAWNPNGRELFYHTGDALMAVSVSQEQQSLHAGVPVRLFPHHKDRQKPGTDYSVTRDGQRFLMVEGVEPGRGPSPRLEVVLNWFEEVKRLVPTK